MVTFEFAMGPSIKYVHKISRKSNISNLRVRIWGLEMLVFEKILRTYLMDDPHYWLYSEAFVKSNRTSGSYQVWTMRLVSDMFIAKQF